MREVKTSAAVRVAMSAALGMVAGLVFSLFNSRYTDLAVGRPRRVGRGRRFLIGTICVALHASTPGETKENALREDPSLHLSELLVLTAGVAVLAAVGLLLDRAGNATGGTKAYLIALGVVSVALSWALVHVTFTLRYARAYYGQPEGGIDFNEDDPPNYLDFAYLAVTIGMTFQVSDTNLTRRRCGASPWRTRCCRTSSGR